MASTMVMTSPTYSMTFSPAAMWRVANTPLPCTRDDKTSKSLNGGRLVQAVSDFCFHEFLSSSVFFWRPVTLFGLLDGALAVYDKTIRMNTELVKTKLTSGGAIPSDVLRDLSVANKQKARLTMRRIALLIETGNAAVMDLIDKLRKIKPVKAT